MRKNWAGNYEYQAHSVLEPQSIAEVQEIVSCARRIKAIGSRHSFNSVADTSEAQISLGQLNRVLAIDPKARTVRVEGGIRYGELAPILDNAGFALANLASLPHISVAGAISTATHGSGSQIGNLATQVVALEIVGPDGDLRVMSKADSPSDFAAAVVSLGAIGVFASITLKVEPRYDVSQIVYRGLNHTQLAAHFDEVFEAGTSVSVFTSWRGSDTSAVWVKTRANERSSHHLSDLSGVVQATKACHPLPAGNSEVCTQQLGIVGPWFRRLPHFEMEFTPSSGAEIQAEFFLERRFGPQAIMAILELGDALAPVLMVSELRTIAADDLWLSPGYLGPLIAIHFTFRRHPEGVRQIVPIIEAALKPFGAVPHWGKIANFDSRYLASRYPNFGRFRDFVQDMDPNRVFSNTYLDHLLGCN